jgi:hypothetical protein
MHSKPFFYIFFVIAGFCGLSYGHGSNGSALDKLSYAALNIRTAVELDFTRSRQIALENEFTLMPSEPELFLKVITGENGNLSYAQKVNLGRLQEPLPVELEVLEKGVTEIKLELEDVPNGRSRINFRFTPKGSSKEHFFSASVNLFTPPAGRIKFSAVDSAGSQIPVLMRIKSVDTEKLYRPAGSIDYNDIMFSIVPEGQHSEFNTFYLYTLSDFEGVFWVVPEAFDMPLPAGKWQVDIYRGLENIPLRYHFELEAGETFSRQFTVKRWVNMAQRGWYSGDDHIHARMMSSQDAQKLMMLAKATDTRIFNILEMGNHDRTWFGQAGFGEKFRYESDGYHLVPGQEDPRSIMGHAIGLNINSLVRDTDKYLLNDWVADQIHAQGGLYGHTHVGEKAFDIYRDMTMLIPRGKSDFNSILQIRLGTEYYYDFLNLGYKLTASAGSDTPYGGVLGLVRLYAYTGKDEPFTPEKWFDAVRAGRTFVTNGPMLEFSVNGKMPGDEIVIEGSEKITVKARAWGRQFKSAPRLLEIVKLGEVVHSVSSKDVQNSELTAEITLDGGCGFWIAAYAAGQNGSNAHTTPVYVRRKGYRHWNFEKAPELIESRLEILEGIEEVVKDAEEKLKAGKLGATDVWSRLPALEADQLRERTAAVRELMNELKIIYKKEKALR